jgi:hypothetical protein
MEFKFECPACGQHLSATPAQIGVTAPCSNCKAAVTVPNPSPHPQSPPPQPIPKSPPVKASIKRKSSLAGIGCLLQGLGLVCLALAFVSIKNLIGPVVFGLLGLWLLFYGGQKTAWQRRRHPRRIKHVSKKEVSLLLNIIAKANNGLNISSLAYRRRCALM